MKIFALLISLIYLIPLLSISQVLSDWRGPNRDGKYNEQPLLKTWPEAGPEQVMEASGLGKGFSSAAVTEEAIYVTGMFDSTDYLSALDLKGKLLWKVPYGRSWNQSFPDTRCTPTVEKDRIYVSSGQGDLACINAKDGKIIWKIEAMKKYGGILNVWGISESLLLINDNIIFTPGGDMTTMIALNKKNGELVWKSESLNDTVNYISPLPIKWGNKDIIVNALDKYIIGVDASNGKFVFKYDFYPLNAKKVEQWGSWAPIYANTPLFDKGYLYVNSGYDFKGVLFKLSDDAQQLSVVWTDTIMDTHHGGNVLVDGYIYGSNYTNGGKDGNWCCIDWKTGKKMYEEKWNTKGSIIFADGMLYVYDEKKGNVGLVKPNPQKFDLVSTFRVQKGAGPYWAHPVIKNGILYLRHGDVLLAYKIKGS
jgi:outer membrane protein assembly factor BamB